MDLNHHTGAGVDGWTQVVQSIETVLATRLNTRVFNREFGSDVPMMVGMPMNDAGIMALYVSVAVALDRWEPRFELSDVSFSMSADGIMAMQLTGTHLPNAHLGDTTFVSDAAQVIQVQATRVDSWRLAA